MERIKVPAQARHPPPSPGFPQCHPQCLGHRLSYALPQLRLPPLTFPAPPWVRVPGLLPREAPPLKRLPHCPRLFQMPDPSLPLLTSARRETLTPGRGRGARASSLTVSHTNAPGETAWPFRGFVGEDYFPWVLLNQKERENQPPRNGHGNPAPAAAQREWGALSPVTGTLRARRGHCAARGPSEPTAAATPGKVFTGKVNARGGSTFKSTLATESKSLRGGVRGSKRRGCQWASRGRTIPAGRADGPCALRGGVGCYCPVASTFLVKNMKNAACSMDVRGARRNHEPAGCTPYPGTHLRRGSQHHLGFAWPHPSTESEMRPATCLHIPLGVQILLKV